MQNGLRVIEDYVRRHTSNRRIGGNFCKGGSVAYQSAAIDLRERTG